MCALKTHAPYRTALLQVNANFAYRTTDPIIYIAKDRNETGHTHFSEGEVIYYKLF